MAVQFRFDGKTALVTGAGRGIGRAIAKALFAAGAKTYALSRTKATLDSLVSECPGIHSVCVDLSDLDGTRSAIEAIGPIDLLVNNAGVFLDKPFVDTDLASFDAMMNVNFKAVVATSQIVAKSLIERGCPGAIVNISSDSAYSAFPGCSAYCASKAALDMLSRVMAVELGRHQIRVNCVNPIVVTTDMANELDSTMLEAYKVRIPLGRFLDVADVVNPVMFLLSDSAAMITGISLVVDGGVTIHSAP